MKFYTLNRWLLVCHGAIYFVFLISIADWNHLGFSFGILLVMFMTAMALAPWVWFDYKDELKSKFSLVWLMLLLVLTWSILIFNFHIDDTAEPLILAAVPIYTSIFNVAYHYIGKLREYLNSSN